MQAVTFEQALECVRQSPVPHPLPPSDCVGLGAALGRVLAEPVFADRDYPALHRAMRDGFAVRAAEVSGALRVQREVRAGDPRPAPLEAGEAVEIMTGAPVPDGADSVVMVEHSRLDHGWVSFDHTPAAGEHINPRGAEAQSGAELLSPGIRLDHSHLAVLATTGCTSVYVYPKPTVAILATGDEIVDAGETPGEHQIRNSNTYALAAQVERSGGIPRVLPIARDRLEETRELLRDGLASRLLLISGGVSAGKYDLVEKALAELGATFFFDRVRIQPGQPLVFGAALGTCFFGLPGNPVSAMVTFETIARGALELAAGETAPSLRITRATLAAPFRQKPGLTRFLPARLASGRLTPLPWAGSSDVFAFARANALLVSSPDREQWREGDEIGVLLK